jgi:transcriptional regulator GlxA family with amidase domain
MKTLPPEVRVMSEVTRPAGFQTAIPQDFLSSLEKITLDLLKAEALRIEAVAEAAELSTRTMQRRLGEIGLTYSTLVARVRCRVAVELLSQTELPVRQIAAAVGYKDPANFTRAFRRIAGKSPQEYRGRCRRAADASCRA